MSIVPPSSIPAALDYTSRDYYSIRENLIARVQTRLPNWTATNPADFGVALVEAFAYMGDLMSYYIDRNVNEAYISTATQRDSVISIAQTYGYTPKGYRQSTLTLEFTNSSESDVVTLQAGTVVFGDILIGDTVEPVYFTTTVDLTLDPAIDNGIGTVTAKEGRAVNRVAPDDAYPLDLAAYGELIGTSDGTPNQVISLGEFPTVEGTVNVYVRDGANYSRWREVSHLIDSNPNDQVFSLTSDGDNVISINFGDGVSGAIPTNFADIRAMYTVGGGEIGNVATGLITNIDYSPGLDVIVLESFVTVTNTTAGVGGSDPESLDQIRYAAPLTLRANTRAVTLDDFNSLALSVPNCGKANALADVWTSVNLYVAPSRDTNTSDTQPGYNEDNSLSSEYYDLATAVSDYLSKRTLIGTTVTIHPPVYVDVIIAVQYSKLPQYTDDEVKASIKTVLTTYYGYVYNDFQQTIYQQDVETVLNNNVVGIKLAKLSAFHLVGDSGVNTITGAADEIFRVKETNISIAAI
jgi:hypothetical protein